MIVEILNKIDSIMYYPILLIVLAVAGLYFTVQTHFVQLRLLKESIRLIMEPPAGKDSVSSFQALMVSTASRVGTGNIVGVSTALCLGGTGRYVLDVVNVYYWRFFCLHGKYFSADL